jgi:hypothetical protein
MMTPVEALTYAVVMAAAASYLLWLLPGPCRCDQCSFHVNERRMAKARAAEEYMGQEELRHEAAHKGFGFKDSDPDKYMCFTADCPRNRPRKMDS